MKEKRRTSVCSWFVQPGATKKQLMKIAFKIALSVLVYIECELIRLLIEQSYNPTTNLALNVVLWLFRAIIWHTSSCCLVLYNTYHMQGRSYNWTSPLDKELAYGHLFADDCHSPTSNGSTATRVCWAHKNEEEKERVLIPLHSYFCFDSTTLSLT